MAEYINREDAERALLERCKETGYGGLTPDDIRLVMRTPWRIPTADVVERKHGKWILVQDFSTEEIEDGEKYWVCSFCGCGSDSYDTTYHTNYCPNCGADMREEPADV